MKDATKAIDPGLIAAAVVAAAEALNVDPSRIVVPPLPRDGSSRVRVLAGAAIASRGWSPHDAAAAVCVNRIQLCVSQLLRHDLTADILAIVQATLDARAAPRREPDLRRNDKGWTDPRRDIEREARVVKQRLAGEGPKAIAAAEKMSVSAVNTILTRSKVAFTPLKRGRPVGSPQVGGRPKGTPPAGGRRPTASAVRPPRAPQAAKTSVPRPGRKVVAVVAPPRPEPVEAIEAFPADHPAWKPLEGTSPVLLIHHDKGCRWPVEITGSAGPMVCNQTTHGKTPYCEPHAWLGASPAIRATMVRPVSAAPEPRVARPFAARDLQDA